MPKLIRTKRNALSPMAMQPTLPTRVEVDKNGYLPNGLTVHQQKTIHQLLYRKGGMVELFGLAGTGKS